MQCLSAHFNNPLSCIKLFLSGKTVDENVVAFKSRINQHISDCRTVTSTIKFRIKIYDCAMKHKSLKEPYFQLNIMKKLKDSRQLVFYKNHFHKKGYDIINCPEYYKKHLNTLSWVYLVNARNLVLAVEKLHSEEQIRKVLV